MPSVALSPGWSPGEPFAVGVLAAGLVVLVALAVISHQGGRAWSASLVYLAIGLAAAGVIHVWDLPWLDPVEHDQVFLHVAELAVVVAVFANGLRIDEPFRAAHWRGVVLLLLVVMPLTIGAVALLGWWGLGLSAGAALLLGAAVAPTDPVLAGDVGPQGPGDEESPPRFALTGEASLNDGLAAPFLLLGLVLLEHGTDAGRLATWAAVDLLLKVVGGAVVGVVAGHLAARFILPLRDNGWLARELEAFVAVGTAVAVYGLAEVAGVYGLAAAFTGGLAFRQWECSHEQHQEVHEGAASVEHALELLVILLVASSVTLDGLGVPGVEGWAIALAVVLVLRPLVGLLVLAAWRRPWRERAFVAWFGVRGIGTVFYAAVVLGAPEVAPAQAELIWWTATAAILVSIPVHGVTAGPLTRRVGA